MSLRDTIHEHLIAGTYGLYIETHEEDRTLREIRAVGKKFEPKKPLYTWTITKGLLDERGKDLAPGSDP